MPLRWLIYVVFGVILGLLRFKTLCVCCKYMFMASPFFVSMWGLCLLVREAWQSQLAMGTLYSDKFDVLHCVSI